MDKPKTTPKDFFLWAGVVVAFYWSVISYILLTFDYINYVFPNPLDPLAYYTIDPYQSGISSEMASIIVLFPLYLFLMKIIRGDISRDPSRKEIWVRRWALILTLFVAGVVIAVDLITLLTTFLNGEALTTAFLLKALIIFLIAAGVFMHFIADLRGYWEMFPARKRMVGVGVAILALATIIAGFFIVGTPAQARLYRFDAQKVSDLQSLQSQITSYYQAKQKLPAALTDLSSMYGVYGSISGLPMDAQTRQSYGYQTTGALSFKLCADFNMPGRVSRSSAAITEQSVPQVSPMGDKSLPDNWEHGAGNVCFDRTIDPSFYPPLTK